MGRDTAMVDQEMKAQETTMKESQMGDDNKFYFWKAHIGRGNTITISQLPKEWQEYVDQKFKDQSGLLKSLSDENKQVVYSAVVSKMENLAAKIANDQCLSNNETIQAVEDIGVSLNEMKDREKEIFDDIQKILKDQKSLNECVSELQKLNERLQWDTSKTLNCCHEILTQIQSMNKRIDEIGMENSTEIEDLKRILIDYIKLAEKRHEEYQTAIIALQDKKYEALSSPGLDERTISEMRDWFQEMSEKNEKEIKQSIEDKKGKLSKELDDIEKNLTDIKGLIKEYGEAHNKKIEELVEELGKKVEEEAEKLQERISGSKTSLWKCKVCYGENDADQKSCKYCGVVKSIADNIVEQKRSDFVPQLITDGYYCKKSVICLPKNYNGAPLIFDPDILHSPKIISVPKEVLSINGSALLSNISWAGRDEIEIFFESNATEYCQ